MGFRYAPRDGFADSVSTLIVLGSTPRWRAILPSLRDFRPSFPKAGGTVRLC